MTIPLKDSYQHQVDCWVEELKRLGHRLDHARWEDEASYISAQVRDLRMRVRKVCDELGVYTDNNDTIDRLIRKILEKLE